MSGRVVIMGSGETAPTMVGTHRAALTAAAADEVVVIDTPFAFQENVELLSARLAEFFATSLGVDVRIASLRTADADPVEVARFRTTLAAADAVFAGPGSPSYALAVWKAFGVGAMLADMVARGGTVTLASAAALTAGSRTIPVYEIYKVGERPFWLTGLDLVADFGVRAAIVPHWNNTEGGNHDTSRCYIGERRLAMLERELDHGIIGVDEHTAMTLDRATGELTVSGRGSVTLRGASHRVVESGETVSLQEVAKVVGSSAETPSPSSRAGTARRAGFEESLRVADVDGMIRAMLAVEDRIPHDPALRGELRSMIVQLADAAGRGLVDPRSVVGGFVELLLELRGDARHQHRFEESDRIRDGLAELGVEVRDTKDGAEWDLDPDAQNP